MRKTWAESTGRARAVLVAICGYEQWMIFFWERRRWIPPRSCLQFSSPPSFLYYFSVASIPLSATVVQAYTGVSTPRTMATSRSTRVILRQHPTCDLAPIFCAWNPYHDSLA
ncbi:hypothetical protein BJ165DRAFT_1517843 [Panaeolus papilionaceus]|nr:hypothetical protein BJ165DRAFT_1517843 [Panaeolus papilionaceus]